MPSSSAPLALFSPWYDYRDAGRAPEGSYRYRGTWETIDHLLLGPGLFDAAGVSYAGSDRFTVISDGLLDAEGSPRRFLRGPPPGGYSDHLPLRLDLELRDPPRKDGHPLRRRGLGRCNLRRLSRTATVSAKRCSSITWVGISRLDGCILDTSSRLPATAASAVTDPLQFNSLSG